MKQGRRTAAKQLLLSFGWSGLALVAEDKLAAPASIAPAKPAPPPNHIDDGLTQLLAVKRLHVSELTGGEAAMQIRDMIIAAIQASGFFSVTENPDRADAFLRGTAEDLVFTDQFSSHDSVGVRSGIGTGRGSAGGRGYERNSASSTKKATSSGRQPKRAWGRNFVAPPQTWPKRSPANCGPIWTARASCPGSKLSRKYGAGSAWRGSVNRSRFTQPLRPQRPCLWRETSMDLHRSPQAYRSEIT